MGRKTKDSKEGGKDNSKDNSKDGSESCLFRDKTFNQIAQEFNKQDNFLCSFLEKYGMLDDDVSFFNIQKMSI